MPAFAVASSKRIGWRELAGACANICATDALSSRNRIRQFKLMSSCALGGRSGHVDGSGGLQQHHGNCILRSRFRTRMTADASTLFAAAHPEESRFTLQCLAGGIEQFDLQRLIAGNLDEEGSVALHWSGTEQLGRSRHIAGIESHRMNRTGSELVFRGVSIQAKQVRVRPIMQS